MVLPWSTGVPGLDCGKVSGKCATRDVRVRLRYVYATMGIFMMDGSLHPKSPGIPMKFDIKYARLPNPSSNRRQLRYLARLPQGQAEDELRMQAMFGLREYVSEANVKEFGLASSYTMEQFRMIQLGLEGGICASVAAGGDQCANPLVGMALRVRSRSSLHTFEGVLDTFRSDLGGETPKRLRSSPDQRNCAKNVEHK